jgi:hypothetical protein
MEGGEGGGILAADVGRGLPTSHCATVMRAPPPKPDGSHRQSPHASESGLKSVTRCRGSRVEWTRAWHLSSRKLEALRRTMPSRATVPHTMLALSIKCPEPADAFSASAGSLAKHSMQCKGSAGPEP